jgi:hypothetical protein
MRRKHPPLTALAAHKQLLVAESELNRAEFGRDLDCLCQAANKLAHEVRSVSSLASAGAALFASGSALRRWLPFKRNDPRRSWMSTLINGVRAGISIWLALRPRVR